MVNYYKKYLKYKKKYLRLKNNLIGGSTSERGRKDLKSQRGINTQEARESRKNSLAAVQKSKREEELRKRRKIWDVHAPPPEQSPFEGQDMDEDGLPPPDLDKEAKKQKALADLRARYEAVGMIFTDNSPTNEEMNFLYKEELIQVLNKLVQDLQGGEKLESIQHLLEVEASKINYRELFGTQEQEEEEDAPMSGEREEDDKDPFGLKNRLQADKKETGNGDNSMDAE